MRRIILSTFTFVLFHCVSAQTGISVSCESVRSCRFMKDANNDGTIIQGQTVFVNKALLSNFYIVIGNNNYDDIVVNYTNGLESSVYRIKKSRINMNSDIELYDEKGEKMLMVSIWRKTIAIVDVKDLLGTVYDIKDIKLLDYK